MAVGGYNIGEAFVQITPSFDDVGRKIDRFFKNRDKVTVPVDIDHRGLSKAVDDAAKRMRGVEVEVTPKVGRRAVEHAAAELNKIPDAARDVTITPKVDDRHARQALDAVSKHSPEVTVEPQLDEKLLRSKLAAIDARKRRMLIDIDVDERKLRDKLDALFAAREAITAEVDVEANVDKLRRDIDRLLDERQHVVTVDADVAEAQRKLELLQAKHDKTILDVDVRTARAQRQLAELRRSAASEHPVMDVQLRIEQAEATLRALAAQRRDVTIHGKADLAAARTEIERLEQLRPRTVAQVDADLSQARAELARLERIRPHLNADVEVEIGRAQAQIDALAARREQITIQADADTANARRKLDQLDEAANRVGSRRPNVTVDASSANRAIGIMALLGAAIAGIGFAAPGAAAAITSIGVASVGLAGVVGSLFAAFQGVGEAVKAMQAADDAAIGNATSNAKQRISAANSVADAQRALGQAHEQANRTAIQSAQSVADAEQALSDTRLRADREAISSARQVADARRAVASAQRDVTEAQEAALRRVQDAERSLAQAQMSARDAQRALTEARRDARESIEDLRLSLKGAALDEESAALALQRAQQKLAEERAKGSQRAVDVRAAELDLAQRELDLQQEREKLRKLQASGTKGLERQQAELRVAQAVMDVDRARAALAQARNTRGNLDLREADLAARQAAHRLSEVRDRQADLRAEVQRTAKAGVAGDERVIAARRRLQEATGQVRSAERDLSEARRDGSRQVQAAQERLVLAQQRVAQAQQQAAWQQQDSARDIAAAQQRVERAQQQAAWAQRDSARSVADAQRQLQRAMQQSGMVGASEMDKVQLAMSKLTPAGQRFARFINDELLPGLQKIGDAVQTATLPKMETALRTMSALGPVLTTVLSDIGSTLGDIAIKGAEMMTSGPWQRDFATLGQTSTAVLRDLGDAGLALSEAFMDIMVAGAPVLRAIAEGFKNWAVNWAGVIDGMRHSGELTAFFETAWDVLQRVWDVVTNVVGAIWDLAIALAPLGDVLFTVIDAAAHAVRWFSQLPGWLTNITVGAALLFAAWVQLGGGFDGVAGAVARAQAGWQRLGARLGVVTSATDRTRTAMDGAAAATERTAVANRAAAASATAIGRNINWVGQSFGRSAMSAQSFGITTTAAATSAASALRGNLVGATTGVVRSLDRVGPATARMQNNFLGASHGIRGALSGIGGAITPVVSRWNAATTQLGTAARNAGTVIRTGLATSITGITNALPGVVSRWNTGMAQIGAAARTAGSAVRTGLGRAVSGLTGALGGPWGLAITGAMVGLGFLVDHFARAGQETAEYKQDVDSLTDSFRQSKGVIDENILASQRKALADAGVGQGARAAGLSLSTYTHALAGNRDALSQVKNGSDAAIRSLLSSAGAGRNVINTFTGLNSSYLTSRESVDALTERFNNSRQSMEAMHFHTARLTDAQQGQLNALLSASSALGRQIRKVNEAREQYITLEAAQSGVTRETVRLWIAQNDLHSQNVTLAQSTLDLEQAQLQVEQARRRSAEALDRYGRGSLEHREALNAEGQALLQAAEQARTKAEADAVGASETERQRLGTQAYNRELGRLVMQSGTATPAIQGLISKWSVAEAVSAGLRVKVDELGNAVAELPDGRTIKLNANPQNARNTVTTTVRWMNGQSGTVTLWADRDPATGETRWWKKNADGTWGRANLDARINPATGKTEVWVKTSNGKWARSNLNANIDPATGRVQAWWRDADGKRAVAVLDADTTPARNAIERFYDWYLGQLREATRPRGRPKGPPLPLPTTGSTGLYLNFHRQGALEHAQRGKLTPMAAGVAQVVPPNSWRVIGDRATGDEAYIPIDNAPRSHAILNVAAQRMGYALQPMATGMLATFQTGAVATPAPAAPAPGAAAEVPVQAILGVDPARIAAAQAALDKLAGSLRTVNAVLAVTNTAVRIVHAALRGATAAAMATTAAVYETRAALAAITTAASTAANAGARVLQNRLLSGLRPALAAITAEITSRSLPTLQALQRHYSVTTVAAITTLRTHLGHLRNGLTQTSEHARTHWAAMTGSTRRNVEAMQTVLQGLRGGLGHVRNAFSLTADWVRTQWGRIRGYTRAPVVDAIRGPFNAGLIFAWNQLDRQFRLNKHINPLPIKFAVGGPVPGMGWRDSVPAMLMPGEYVWSTQAIKNLGGVENVDRLHQMARAGTLGPDARLGDATDAHKRQRLMRAVPLDDLPHAYAYGGVQPHVARAGKEIERVFGRLPGGIGGVGQRANASDHPSGHALDFMTMSNMRLGDRIATHLMRNSQRLLVKYLIWKQKINEGSGWDPMEDRGSITANHFDHVHASFLRLGQAGKLFGGALFDPQAIVNGQFAKAQKLINRYLAKYKGNHHGEIAGGEARYALNRLKKVGVTRLNDLMMAGEGVGTGVQRWRPVVVQALKMLGLPLGWANLTLRRMEQESSGNPRSINQWDTNAAAGTPSKGLMQVIDPTFQSYRDPRLPNDIWNPLANVVASMRYAMSRYGSLPAAYNRPGGYDTGGWLPPGVSTTVNHTGKPEAVLTWDQWRDIHRLASVSGGAGGGRTVQVYARTDADPTHIAHTVDRHLSIGSRL